MANLHGELCHQLLPWTVGERKTERKRASEPCLSRWALATSLLYSCCLVAPAYLYAAVSATSGCIVRCHILTCVWQSSPGWFWLVNFWPYCLSYDNLITRISGPEFFIKSLKNFLLTPPPPTSITGGCFWFKKINTVFPLCDCPDGTGIHLKVTMSDMQGCMAAVTYGFCSWLPSICICKSEHGRSLDIHPADPPTTSIGLHPPPLFIFSIHSLSPE